MQNKQRHKIKAFNRMKLEMTNSYTNSTKDHLKMEAPRKH